MTVLDFSLKTMLKIKPGDFIAWEYQADNFLVIPDDKIWTSLEKRWVDVSEKMLVISVINDTLALLSESEGLFTLALADITNRKTFKSNEYITPRLLHRNSKRRQKTIIPTV